MIDKATEDEAKRKLGRVIVNLTLQHSHTSTSTPFGAAHQLEFEGVSSELAGDATTGIMVARTKLIYEWAQQDLEKSKEVPLSPAEAWRANGVMQKADSGDFNFPRGLLTLTKTPSVSGVAQGDPNHHPIILFSEYDETLDWRIACYDEAGYNKKFTAIVTGDLSMYDHVFRDQVPAPQFENIFDDEVFTGTNGNVVSGPAQLRTPNYVFFKYHVILLDSPFATHDPDVICGSPIR